MKSGVIHVQRTFSLNGRRRVSAYREEDEDDAAAADDAAASVTPRQIPTSTPTRRRISGQSVPSSRIFMSRLRFLKK